MVDLLFSNLLNFIREQHLNLGLERTNDSEFWLESQKVSLVTKFVVDTASLEVVYDIFAPELDRHLKVEGIRDLEAVEFGAEIEGKWKLGEALEEIWLLLDQVKLWAQENKFKAIKEVEMI